MSELEHLVAEGATPIGSIVAFAGPESKVPSEWLVCDGRVLKRKTYDLLFNQIGTTWGGDGADGFYLPDLRGLFLRGVDGTANMDPDHDSRTPLKANIPNPGARGNNVGSLQTDALQRHGHEVSFDFAATGSNGSRDADGGEEKFNCHPPAARLSIQVNDPKGANVSNETRPRNAFVHWIIRVR
jgi:microcystin-dependent protein